MKRANIQTAEKNYETGKDAVLKALSEKKGLVYHACKEAGISRWMFYEWKKKYPEFAEQVDSIGEEQGDYVEGQLLELIKEKNPAAVIYYCKTKLRNRGYSERIEHVGLNDGPIQVQHLSDTELAAIINRG